MILLYNRISRFVPYYLKGEFAIKHTAQKAYLSFSNGASPFAIMAQNEKNPKFVGTVDGIIRNCVFDFGCFLNMDITNEVMEGLSQKSDNIVSGLTSNGNRVKGILRRLIKDFEGD